jgi:hypothetical protein
MVAHRINRKGKGYPVGERLFSSYSPDELHGCLDARRMQIENAFRAVVLLFRVEGAESGEIKEREIRLWINLFCEAVRRNSDGEALGVPITASCSRGTRGDTGWTVHAL